MVQNYEQPTKTDVIARAVKPVVTEGNACGAISSIDGLHI